MKPFFLFAPGAGAPSTHSWMRRWKKLLEQIGHVETFDYDYMREKRRRSDPLRQLIANHREALHEKLQMHSAVRSTYTHTVLIGKSMGGRIGCHVALEEKVSALVCLGYPLCAMGDRTKLRDKVLLDLKTPILFVQGTRDPLCPLDLLEEVGTRMTAPNFLHVVQDGDHSLLVTKRALKMAGETQEDVDLRAANAIAKFISKL